MSIPPPPPLVETVKKKPKKWDKVDTQSEIGIMEDIKEYKKNENFHDLDFSQFGGIMYSNTTMFVLLGGGLVVLKPNVGAAEYYAFQIGSLLNVSLPESRIMNQEEIDIFHVAKIMFQAKSNRDNITEETMEMILRGSKKIHDVLLMEYIKNTADETINDSELRDIARILLFDIVICNFDRFPIWTRLLYPRDSEFSFDSNAGNMLFSNGRVFAVDQTIKSGHAPRGDLKLYYEKLSEISADLYENKNNCRLVSMIINYFEEMGMKLILDARSILYENFLEVITEWSQLTYESFDNISYENNEKRHQENIQFIIDTVKILSPSNESKK